MASEAAERWCHPAEAEVAQARQALCKCHAAQQRENMSALAMKPAVDTVQSPDKGSQEEGACAELAVLAQVLWLVHSLFGARPVH